MNRVKQLKDFVDAHRELIFELVRIYLGLGLFAKGLFFVTHPGDITTLLARTDVPLSIDTMIIGHAVAIAHLCGGVMVAVGLVTRLAAAVQLPILFGAVFLVHLREGFFGADQNLEVALLVLFLLALTVVHGGGRLSVDSYLSRKFELQSPSPEPHHT